MGHFYENTVFMGRKLIFVTVFSKQRSRLRASHKPRAQQGVKQADPSPPAGGRRLWAVSHVWPPAAAVAGLS